MLVFHACKPVALGPDEFVAWCDNEEQGLVQKRTFNNLVYSLKYEPVDYKVVSELLNTGRPVTAESVNKLRQEYEGLYYFVFKIEEPGSQKSPVKSLAKNKEDLAKLTHYCQSALMDEFYMESGGLKVPCAIFHMEDDYSLTNFNLMAIAFEKSRIDAVQDLLFVFNDPFFKTGTIKFTIPKEFLTKLPKLKLS